MNRLASLLQECVVLVTAVAVGVTCLALAGLTQLEFEDSYRRIFRSQDLRFQQLEQLATQFSAGDNDCLVLFEANDILNRASLRTIRQAHFAMNDVPGVQTVVSLCSARSRRRVGRYFLPVLPGEDADVSDEWLDRAREELKLHPIVQNRLLSDDAKSTLMVVRLEENQQSIEQVDGVLRAMRESLSNISQDTKVTATVTGLPAIRSNTIHILKYEHLVISMVGVVLAIVVSWFLLRRLGYVVIVATPAIFGIVWTLGLMGWTGQPLGMINAVLPALLMVIGVSDAMHLLFHFRRESAGPEPQRQAAFDSVAQLGNACFLTSLTTGIGFGSLMVCQDETIRMFGLWAAIGVVVTFVGVVVLFPLLATSALGRNGTVASVSSPSGARITARLTRFVTLHAKAIAVVSIGLIAASTVLAVQVRPDYSFTEHLSDSSPTCRAIRHCERQFGGIPLLQVMVGWTENRPPGSSDLIDVLSEVHRAIDRSSVARHPSSLLTLLESLPHEEDDLRTALAEIQYVPDEVVRQVIRSDENLSLVTAVIPDAGAAALAEPLSAIEKDFHEIEDRHAGFSVALTGYIPVATARTNSMIWDLVRSLGLAAIVIVMVIALAFRSPWFGLISILPNALPLLATAAMMVLLGRPLQYSTVLAFSVCLGIAADDTIHFLARYRRERSLASNDVAVRRTLEAIAPVLMVTTLLMLVGFGAAFWGSMLTVQAFALFSCAAMIFALVGDLFALPALFLVCSRKPELNAMEKSGE